MIEVVVGFGVVLTFDVDFTVVGLVITILETVDTVVVVGVCCVDVVVTAAENGKNSN